MKYRIFITVDENDADYQISDDSISEEDLIMIRELLEKVKEFKPYKSSFQYPPFLTPIEYTFLHNFPVGEVRRKDLGEKSVYELYGEEMRQHIDLFLKLCPYLEFGFHSILQVEVVPEKEIVRLF